MTSALSDHADLRTALVEDVDEAWVEPPVDPADLARHRVTAVLVSHDGGRWLPDVLAALDAATRRPERIVAVDTGSTDGSDATLAGALGEGAVVRVGRDTGFGEAVGTALAARPALPLAAGEAEWVWLLHDDCAPAPDALERLLELAVRRPDATVIGPKVREWRPGGRQLLELGLTVTGNGRRYTGLERREFDQGQHDEVREVLAVGSAGMLVRRDVLATLGGFDPHLGVFRDDLDLGWRANAAGQVVLTCPAAVVRHAEAAAHGRRRLATTRDRVHLVDRRNALYVLLANASPRRFPLVLLRTVLGCLVRALGFLLGKQPAIAGEELAALGSVVGRPGRLRRARRDRAATRTGSRDLSPLFPGFAVQLRQTTDTLRGLVAGTSSGQDLPTSRRRASTFEDGEEDEDVGEVTFLAALLRPWILLGAGLAVAALVAARGLFGTGRLMGGALLPAPDSAAALWDTYVTSWHTTGLGSPTPTPPYVAVVAGLGALLGGSASVAVDVLLLASVPLAGLSAWVATRGLVGSRVLRVWGALVWALLPATTGAVAAGRLGTAAAAVVLPLLVRTAVRAVVDPGLATDPAADPLRPPLNRSFAAGVLLAVVAAFAPVLLVVALMAAVAALGAVARARRDRSTVLGTAARLGIALLTALALLLPWTLQLLRDPRLLLVEAGLPGPGLSDPELPAWAIALGSPGGPGSAPAWLLAGVLAAALGGLFRPDRRRTVLAAWLLALLGLGTGLVLAHTAVTAPTLETPVVAWAGPAALVVVAGLLVAAMVGAETLPPRLAAASFSWRQPVAVLVTVVAVLTPVLAVGWWVARGADDPLDRRDPRVLPAYVVDEAARPDRPRTVVLRRADDGRVTYALVRDSGPRLGDAETAPPLEDSAVLDEVIGDLLSGRGGDAVDRLSRFAVRYLFLPGPVDPEIADVLDAVPGVVRASAPEGSAMWRLEGVTSRLRVVDDGEAQALPSGRVDAETDVPAGGAERTLLLAETADPGWRALLDGEPLAERTVDGWAQGFALPADAGTVEITHTGRARSAWLVAELVLLVVAIVLALPGLRRDPAAVDDAADLDPDQEPLPQPAGPVGEPVPVGAHAGDPWAFVVLLGAGRGARRRGKRAAPTARARRRRRGAPLSAEDWLREGGVPEERALAAAADDDEEEQR